MNLALSTFDVFTYAIPGSIYLAILIYISNRLDWIRVEAADSLNTTMLFFGAVLASYLLGHITYQLGRAVERMLPKWKQGLPFFLLRLRFEQRRQPLRSTDFVPSDLCFEIAFLRSSSLPQVQSLNSLLAKNGCSQQFFGLAHHGCANGDEAWKNNESMGNCQDARGFLLDDRRNRNVGQA